MNKERLETIAKFLDILPPEKFDIGDFVTESKDGCGTVCCAIGWLPEIFPRNFKWRESYAPGVVLTVRPIKDSGDLYTESSVHAFLGIDFANLQHLFYAGCQFGRKRLTLDTTPQQLAAHIRKFIGGAR
jgi:hypothetical protein